VVSFLASSGKPGREALERLASGGGPVARLAEIALARSFSPSEGELDAFLADGSSDVRAAAVEAFLRRLSRERLERLALDIDPRVRVAAVNGLSREGFEGSARLLVDALRKDPDSKVRAAAAGSGSALGKSGLDALRGALGDPNMGVVHAALRGLATLGTPEALALVEDRMKGPMRETAVVAAAALAKAGRESGRRRMAEALVDDRPNVRITALLHLEQAGLGSPSEIRLGMLDDEDPRVVLAAAAALRRNEDARERVLAALRKTADGPGQEASEARDMLAVLGDEKAVEEVAALLAESDMQELLAVLPRVSGSASLRPVFASLLADERTEVRVQAARCVLRSSYT
jgi:HEAT repeat protein